MRRLDLRRMGAPGLHWCVGTAPVLAHRAHQKCRVPVALHDATGDDARGRCQSHSPDDNPSVTIRSIKGLFVKVGCRSTDY